ncbi:hypothetical protein ERJ75_000493300 [Trypanosoma vivax]|nr:hypothetical protein ERJ75_000493300 [Trypanosoma vivax]
MSSLAALVLRGVPAPVARHAFSFLACVRFAVQLVRSRFFCTVISAPLARPRDAPRLRAANPVTQFASATAFQFASSPISAFSSRSRADKSAGVAQRASVSWRKARALLVPPHTMSLASFSPRSLPAPSTHPHSLTSASGPRGAAWLAAGPLSTAVALSSVGAHAAKDARTLQHRTAALLTRAPPRRACRAVAWQHVLPPPLHDKPLAPSTPLSTIRGVPLASAAKSFRQRTLAARRPVCPRETPAAPRHARGSLGYASRRRSPRPNARARRGGERAAASKAERACEGGWCASHERRTASSARDAWATAAAVTGQSAFHVDCPECGRVGARQLTPASTRRTQEATELRPHVGARAAPQQRGLAGG